MKNISIFGIFLGMLSSIVVFVALNFLMVVVFKYFLPETGLVSNLPLRDFMLIYLTVAIGVSSFTGGYIATRIAQNGSYVNAIILGLLMIFYFVLLGAIKTGPEVANAFPAWKAILDGFVMVAFALLGCFVRGKTAKKEK